MKTAPTVHVCEHILAVAALSAAVLSALYSPNCCFTLSIAGKHGALQPGPGEYLFGQGDTLGPAEGAL